MNEGKQRFFLKEKRCPYKLSLFRGASSITFYKKVTIGKKTVSLSDLAFFSIISHKTSLQMKRAVMTNQRFIVRYDVHKSGVIGGAYA